MQRKIAAAGICSFAIFAAGAASAHISITSGLATANASALVTFGVGHGCAGADTSSVVIEIPEGVTSVRPLSSDFGQIDVMTDSAGVVTAVSFTKATSAVLASDLAFYELKIRLKAPDQPFSTLHFPAHQTCTDSQGNQTVVDWVALEESDNAEPAPRLALLPQRFPGWNRFTVSQDVSDLSAFFGNAEIVWRDDSAYSINPTTIDLIKRTEGVSLLESLSADDQIWVKY